MDHYSILGEPEPVAARTEERVPSSATPAGLSPDPHEPSQAADEREPAAPEATFDFFAVLKHICDQAQYVTGASAAAIAMKEGRMLVCRAASGAPAPAVGVPVQVKAGLTAECIRSSEAQRCDNALSDERVDGENCARLGIESIVVMPVLRRGKLAGIIEVFSKQAYAFQERDVEALRGFTEMISAAIARANLSQDDEGWDALLPGAKPQLQVVASNPKICPQCGGALDENLLQCRDCGGFPAGAEAAQARSAGLRRAGGLRPARVLLPLLFLSLAALVAMVPLRRSNPAAAPATSPDAVSAAPAPPASASVSAKPGSAASLSTANTPAATASTASSPKRVAEGASKGLPAPEADPNAAPATTPDPTIAEAVKGLIAGVSSDVSRLLPISREEEPPPPSPGNPATKVWVATRKGFYYCPGDAYYGKTARGVYMTQREAQADYYTPALQKNCP